MDLGIKGKVAIVTGGSNGIGRAAAERLCPTCERSGGIAGAAAACPAARREGPRPPRAAYPVARSMWERAAEVPT